VSELERAAEDVAITINRDRSDYQAAALGFGSWAILIAQLIPIVVDVISSCVRSAAGIVDTAVSYPAFARSEVEPIVRRHVESRYSWLGRRLYRRQIERAVASVTAGLVDAAAQATPERIATIRHAAVDYRIDQAQRLRNSLRGSVWSLAIVLGFGFTAADAQSIEGPAAVPEHRLGRYEVRDLPANSVVFWVLSPDTDADLEDLNNRVVIAGPPGRYRLRALIVTVNPGEAPTKKDLRFDFTIHATTPTPGPGPGPGPGPDPDPDPVDPPTPSKGVSRVLVYYETGANLTRQQIATLNDPALRNYLSQITVQAGDGLPAWKIWDRHVNTTNASPDWQTAVSQVTIPATVATTPIVFVFDDDGRVDSFPLPDSPDATIAELKRREGN
jgi:hypothetical protein